jgi:hypothetical protein
LNTENTEKSIPWLLYAVTILGCTYILGYVFPRVAHYEAENSLVATRAVAVPRSCLELTSDQGTAGERYGLIRGWVRNNCEKRFNFVEVEYKLYGAGGDVVGGAMTNLAALGPYESWRFEAVAMQPYKRYQLAHVSGDSQ